MTRNTYADSSCPTEGGALTHASPRAALARPLLTVLSILFASLLPTHVLRAQTTTVESQAPPCDFFDIASNGDTVSIAVGNKLEANNSGIAIGPNGDINKKKPIERADVLIKNTLGAACKVGWRKDDYVIVHLVQWPSSLKAGQQKYDPEFEKWFLFRNLGAEGQAPDWQPQTAQDGTRIYGHKRVAVLLVHVNPLQTWDIRYTVDLKAKTPANIQNALDLAGIIAGGKAARSTSALILWGGRLLNVKDIPSDIIVQSNFVFVNSTARADGKQGDDSQQTQQAQTFSKTYDNEGRYRWDVSVGLPVKSFKEVKYDAENGQVTAREVDRQNAYGFLNLFFRKVDTKGNEYSYSKFYKTAHLVLGVPISGKPLDRPMAGLGFGFYKTAFKFNVFAGAVFNRVREPRTLAAGQTATPAQLEGDLETHRVTKFIFGFNIPVKQFKDALSTKK